MIEHTLKLSAKACSVTSGTIITPYVRRRLGVRTFTKWLVITGCGTCRSLVVSILMQEWLSESGMQSGQGATQPFPPKTRLLPPTADNPCIVMPADCDSPLKDLAVTSVLLELDKAGAASWSGKRSGPRCM